MQHTAGSFLLFRITVKVPDRVIPHTVGKRVRGLVKILGSSPNFFNLSDVSLADVNAIKTCLIEFVPIPATSPCCKGGGTP